MIFRDILINEHLENEEVGLVFRPGVKNCILKAKLGSFLALGKRDFIYIYCYYHYCYFYYYYYYYESQPVGLAEVISASEASLGGPGGRASQMCKNRVK